MTFGNTKTGKTGTSTSEATETAQIKSVESLDKGNDMERGLKNRHVQFIAIGGTIGTGLFLGSGKSIALTGPSIILVYIGVGLIMFLLMRAIGEMMYSDPSQHTFINFITRYLGRAWGKFAGWTYWIVLILTGMTEITDSAPISSRSSARSASTSTRGNGLSNCASSWRSPASISLP